MVAYRSARVVRCCPGKQRHVLKSLHPFLYFARERSVVPRLSFSRSWLFRLVSEGKALIVVFAASHLGRVFMLLTHALPLPLRFPAMAHGNCRVHHEQRLRITLINEFCRKVFDDSSNPRVFRVTLDRDHQNHQAELPCTQEPFPGPNEYL